MPAVFLWLLAASGVVLAAPVGRGRDLGARRGSARVLAGLACLLLAVTPWLLLRSQSDLEAASAAFHRGDCRAAIDDALPSRDALSVRAEPFELIGYCDLRVGRERAGGPGVRGRAQARPGQLALRLRPRRSPGPAPGRTRVREARDARRLNPREPRGARPRGRVRAMRAGARGRASPPRPSSRPGWGARRRRTSTAAGWGGRCARAAASDCRVCRPYADKVDDCRVSSLQGNQLDNRDAAADPSRLPTQLQLTFAGRLRHGPC